MDLFDQSSQEQAPLYDRLRPTRLEDFFGQEGVLHTGSALREAIRNDRPFPMLLWGPPGTGKTTLAHIVASQTGHRFVKISAIFTGVKDLKAILEEAANELKYSSRKTILFIDEIHRYNKAQQDALLPHLEAGHIVLIGATTENPGFEINAALLSRLRLVVFEPLSPEALERILERGLALERKDHHANADLIDANARAHLLRLAQGDARILLRNLELVARHLQNETSLARPLGREAVEAALSGEPIRYDKAGDEHYDLASALIKSMRGSDPDAAVYYLARMLEGGEDPKFCARRLVIFASEDVGMADARALPLAVAAQQAVHFVGMPEAAINLSHAAVYLACAPKSNASYMGLRRAQAAIRETGPQPVPKHIRNAPTNVHRRIGAGEGYRYPHDFENHWVDAYYLPDDLRERVFYEPGELGDEAQVAERIRGLRARRAAGDDSRETGS